MRIYIAGRIRGVENYREGFIQAADKFRSDGWDTFNPACANQEGRPLNKIMAYLLPQLCGCDAIAMLPRWYLSGGARIEWLLAKYLKLQILYL